MDSFPATLPPVSSAAGDCCDPRAEPSTENMIVTCNGSFHSTAMQTELRSLFITSVSNLSKHGLHSKSMPLSSRAHDLYAHAGNVEETAFIYCGESRKGMRKEE